MKKFLAVLLVLVLAVGLVACGSTAKTSSSSAASSSKAASSSSSAAASSSKASSSSAAASSSKASSSSAAASSSTKKLTFALLPKTLTNPYFVAMKDFAQKACDKVGVELLATAPTEETMVDEQIAMFEQMMTKNVSGIIICPNGTDEIVASIKKANAAKVPVITVDTNATGGDILSFIGTNNYEGGKLAGKWVSDNCKGNVACITGVPGNKTHTDRTQGFQDGIKGSTTVKLVADPVPGYCERAQGMTQAENLLTAHPDIVAIYCCNDEMAMGAGEAVKAAGKTGQVKVIGFDGAPTTAQGIIDGSVTASVAQAPGKMAQLAVEAMYAYLSKGTKPQATVDTGCTMVTSANAKEYLSWH